MGDEVQNEVQTNCARMNVFDLNNTRNWNCQTCFENAKTKGAKKTHSNPMLGKNIKSHLKTMTHNNGQVRLVVFDATCGNCGAHDDFSFTSVDIARPDFSVKVKGEMVKICEHDLKYQTMKITVYND
jgi:hypothetical protein